MTPNPQGFRRRCPDNLCAVYQMILIRLGVGIFRWNENKNFGGSPQPRFRPDKREIRRKYCTVSIAGTSDTSQAPTKLRLELTSTATAGTFAAATRPETGIGEHSRSASFALSDTALLEQSRDKFVCRLLSPTEAYGHSRETLPGPHPVKPRSEPRIGSTIGKCVFSSPFPHRIVGTIWGNGTTPPEKAFAAEVQSSCGRWLELDSSFCLREQGQDRSSQIHLVRVVQHEGRLIPSLLPQSRNCCCQGVRQETCT